MNDIFSKFKYDQNCVVNGLTKNLISLYITNYFNNNDKNVLVLTSNLYEANNYYKLIGDFIDDVLFFPMDDFITSMAIAISPDFKMTRLNTLNELRNKDKKHIVITSLMGYLKYLPDINSDQYFEITPSPSNISREIILSKLEEYGYKKESIVTSTGEYAVRGYIIDIFPFNYEHPIRIEFFDNTVEKIREFDESTQLSNKAINNVKIERINEPISEKKNNLMDYLDNETLFLIDENQVLASYNLLNEQIMDYNKSKNIEKIKYMFDYNEINCNSIYKINSINSFSDTKSISYKSESIINFNSNFANLKDFCLNKLDKYTVIFTLNNQKQIKIITELFNNNVSLGKVIKNKINIINNNNSNGFIFDEYIVIGPRDIENVTHKNIKYKNSYKVGHRLKSSNDIKIGDYIIHESYGIGIYNGIKTLTNGGFENDYIQLIYADNDKIYIDVNNIDKLYKYNEVNGRKPKLDKLNSNSWNKKKIEARQTIKDMSGELIELYSARSKIKNTPFRDYVEEEVFAAEFPYELTGDQKKSIEEINDDLKSDIPMDRLLCGDVGYGKTEVAFRAIFKTILNNKCVLYLCPTTLLSKQQYDNALERFKSFPVSIRLLNRYITTKETNKIIDEINEGKIDLLIGTHKLLNNKIKYNNLGLLVIDEEQRFGVSQKEKIKQIKNDVNVLTLSATPIPRTLKMALGGLRGLSLIDTPPMNRYPIETYVLEENDLIIREAIYKELSRNGQVYLLVNDISELDAIADKIHKLAGEARIAVAHGQMSSKNLNDIMTKFINCEIDVLICTTIIETGIDISNVNTIIIINSDHFGLSQLYQIRGRVGRSDRIGYAYLMYRTNKVLTDTAKKRLDSIKEFTELGSGYKIALRDLSIRGAGDILGREQAGFIDAVGLDLYTKMINEELHGVQDNRETNKQNILNVSNHIDSTYAEDDEIIIEIHQLINNIKSYSDYKKVKSELEDRFGKINDRIEVYMLEKCIENYIEKTGSEINQTSSNVTIVLSDNMSKIIDGEKLFMITYKINPKYKISYRSGHIRIELPTQNLAKNYIYYIFELITELESMEKNI